MMLFLRQASISLKPNADEKEENKKLWFVAAVGNGDSSQRLHSTEQVSSEQGIKRGLDGLAAFDLAVPKWPIIAM
jgi:hypothetical protein